MFAKRAREARDGAVGLLGHHLEGTMRIGMLLSSQTVRAPAPGPGQDAADIRAAHAALRADVARLLELELALLAKLRQARHWAAKLTGKRERLSPFARLFLAASATLDEALARLAEAEAERFETAGQAIAFLKSRALVPPDVGDLGRIGDIATSEDYRLGGTVRLGDVLESCEGFLAALDGLGAAEGAESAAPDGSGTGVDGRAGDADCGIGTGAGTGEDGRESGNAGEPEEGVATEGTKADASGDVLALSEADRVHELAREDLVDKDKAAATATA